LVDKHAIHLGAGAKDLFDKDQRTARQGVRKNPTQDMRPVFDRRELQREHRQGHTRWRIREVGTQVGVVNVDQSAADVVGKPLAARLKHRLADFNTDVAVLVPELCNEGGQCLAPAAPEIEDMRFWLNIAASKIKACASHHIVLRD
jgi:hypothetical protein